MGKSFNTNSLSSFASNIAKKMKAFFIENRYHILQIAIFVVVSSVFVLVFSQSTSPLYKNYYAYGGAHDSGDSLQFLTIGKEWSNGKVPYRDNFDHKGPFIFLIDALGFLIGGGTRYGICLFQIIALTITLFYIYKIGNLVSKDKSVGYLSIIATLIFYSLSYVVGNSVQEYNLPFIAISVYFIVAYLGDYKKDKNSSHDPKKALFYGIAIGICFCTLITNAILICVGVLAIAIKLIAEKRYKNLWKNIKYGIVGFLAILLPFSLYFAANDCFGDFIYSTLLFNFQYTGNIGSWLKTANSDAIVSFITVFFSYLSIFITIIFAISRRAKYYVAMLVFACVLETYLFFSAQSFNQYATLSLIQIVLLINEIYICLKGGRNLAPVALVTSFIVTLICYNQVLASVYYVSGMYKGIRDVAPIGYEELVEEVLPEIHESSFVAYGGNDLKGIYLRYDIPLNNKYFTIQDWHSSFSPNVREAILEDFKQSSAEYALLPNVASEGIEEILEDDYKIINANDKYRLFKKIAE